MADRKPISDPIITSSKKCCDKYTLENAVRIAINNNTALTTWFLFMYAMQVNMANTEVAWPDGKLLYPYTSTPGTKCIAVFNCSNTTFGRQVSVKIKNLQIHTISVDNKNAYKDLIAVLMLRNKRRITKRLAVKPSPSTVINEKKPSAMPTC